MMPDRAPGYYWVRVPLSIEHPHFAGWTIAEYNPAWASEPWAAFGETHRRGTNDLDEIGPRVESPEEMGDERAALLAFLDEMRVKYEAAEMNAPSDKHLQYAASAATMTCEEIIDAIKARGPVTDLRKLRAALHHAEDEVRRLTEMLAGRDEEIRALRAKVGGKLNQVAAPRETEVFDIGETVYLRDDPQPLTVHRIAEHLTGQRATIVTCVMKHLGGDRYTAIDLPAELLTHRAPTT